MPITHPAIAALTAADAHRLLHVQRHAVVLLDTESPADLIADQGRAIIYQGALYVRDDADTVSVHDGVWTLVSNDGVRFKRDRLAGPSLGFYQALDKDLIAPPLSPAFGDHYLVPSGATGAWAGWDNDLAVYTSWGWQRIAAASGAVAWVADEAAYYHRAGGGSWTNGFGPFSTTPASVRPIALMMPLGVAVENETTVTPPAATDGVAYIAGVGATGAWAGRDGDVAIGNGGGWEFLTPADGDIVWNKASAKFRRRATTAWQDAIVPGQTVQHSWATPSDSSQIFLGSSHGFGASNTTAPSTANGAAITSLGLSGKTAGNELKIEYQALLELTAGSLPAYVWLALFIENSSSALHWTYETLAAGQTVFRGAIDWTISLPDALAHTFTVRAGVDTGVTTATLSIKRQRFLLTEVTS